MSIDSQIYQCDYNAQRYRQLKRQLETLNSYLASAKDDCIDLKSLISNAYQVNDGESAVRNRASNLANNIVSTYNTINSSVIPAIDSAINGLNNQKYNLQVEKQKQEAEKAK